LADGKTDPLGVCDEFDEAQRSEIFRDRGPAHGSGIRLGAEKE
jgi:hypothetical protein